MTGIHPVIEPCSLTRLAIDGAAARGDNMR